jgi:hypothetical protein
MLLYAHIAGGKMAYLRRLVQFWTAAAQALPRQPLPKQA